ncbi:unnamed protein product [Caenorhabditis bovis]|uniref:Uncharacterized protein n=1 Tax=Caenorhabditis bovis TaxID=2654633 RepID=A0A8S1EHY5_9PELO|nr:unnamed protein product [Caenorhabditis bovis]
MANDSDNHQSLNKEIRESDEVELNEFDGINQLHEFDQLNELREILADDLNPGNQNAINSSDTPGNSDDEIDYDPDDRRPISPSKIFYYSDTWYTDEVKFVTPKKRREHENELKAWRERRWAKIREEWNNNNKSKYNPYQPQNIATHPTPSWASIKLESSEGEAPNFFGAELEAASAADRDISEENPSRRRLPWANERPEENSDTDSDEQDAKRDI